MILRSATTVVVAALAALAMLVAPAPGQTPPSTDPSTATNAPPPPPPPPPSSEPAWSFDFSAYTYFVPDDREYVQPTLTADRDWLHLEARYNYEAVDTGSLWVGYNLSAGDELALEITPMLGGVFGDTSGIAPGYKGSLGWRQFELYSEGEDPIDTDDSSASFFYNWSELTFAPTDAFRFGLVTQRTRLYHSDRDIQRGLLVGFASEKWNVTGYVFNPDDSKPTFVFAFGLSF